MVDRLLGLFFWVPCLDSMLDSMKTSLNLEPALGTSAKQRRICIWKESVRLTFLSKR
jgi:hypothetical protein